MILLDFQCPEGHRFERLCQRPAPDETRCDCGSLATRAFTAPHVKIQLASAVRQGPPEEAPPGALDTRALAEGQPLSEWKRERGEKRARERRDAAWREARS